MANKKKDRPRTFESLNRRPQNPLDARVLALKRKAREQTLQRHGQEPLGPPQVPVNTTPIADPTQVLDDEDNNDPNDEMDDHMNAPPLDPSMDPPEVVLVDDDAIHALNRGFYSGRRAHEEVQWQKRHPAMFQAYLQLQRLTRDWSNQLFDHDFEKTCQCQGTPRTLDVLDLFFRCQSCFASATQMIKQGSSMLVISVVPQMSQSQQSPFALALAEFLDPGNPIFLVKSGEKAREWHRTLSSAMDGYQKMLIMSDEAASKALRLSKDDELAFKCPQCFGPDVDPLPNSEPDHCVCIDGNFQYCRHLAASIELGGIITPFMFLPPEELEAMRASVPTPWQRTSKKKHWAEEEVTYRF
ncbi:uncharacterized protein MELLADRAFT_92224 [Melampsora larici-populina 98AG31]|uniref:CxC1-like cysteine cluster associated with KDZ transposases domain-containing protein n=1 Tax=Melampsora larici-populina (strain 98AG31 / pathotype 3-4-7) TaxID=747676 RepID=F4R8V7_MELLP|nr:uncharacterized protein MELLADRAFT_92224 [Melampsora larici-populina 98AG31]EGG11263.1 hypothetical protein MELLADRAFT_92224 [Melampsora larici-populina 98AG31]